MQEVIADRYRSDTVRLRIFRIIRAFAVLAAFLCAGSDAEAQGAGPSFPCIPQPADALARLTCSDRELAGEDIRLVQTYYALRHIAGPDGLRPLRSEFLGFIVRVRNACGLPPVEPQRDQSAVVFPPRAAACVRDAYAARRADWFRRLSGPAAEEAAREPERNVALQAKLNELALLPAGSISDGVFGAATRAAIAAWQRSAGRLETGLLSDADAQILVGSPGAAPSASDPYARFVSKALSESGFRSPSVTIVHRDLRATLTNSETTDQQACQKANEGLVPFGQLDAKGERGCRVLALRIESGGRTVLDMPVTSVTGEGDIERLGLKLAIRQLDSRKPEPQVVLSGYSGGAHCCTATVVATVGPDGAWTTVDLGQMDGDRGFAFLDLGRDESVVLADVDQAFLYRFASYSGSFAPTKLGRFEGGALRDVTRDPSHAGFLLRELHRMERLRLAGGSSEPNGYLAGWVAQKALVGQLADAWRAMLATYDRRSTDGLIGCAVAERAWADTAYGGGKACPDGQERPVPFPEELVLFLLKSGYVTAAQSAGLGYDPAVVDARRTASVNAATEAYEQQAAKGWFLVSRAGVCTLARNPATPADLVLADRNAGLEDRVQVLQSDASGVALSVLVAQPRPNGLESVSTFHRGLARCESVRRSRQRDLELLR